jgi:hypothetical protein
MENVADQIMAAIEAAGNRGLLTSVLKNKLNLNSNTLTHTIEQLTSKGFIMQKQEAAEDRRLFISADFISEPETSHLSDLGGCPCFHCLKLSKCGARQPDSPVKCRDLEEWLNTVSTE